MKQEKQSIIELIVEPKEDYFALVNREKISVLKDRGIGISYGDEYLLHLAEILYLLESGKYIVKIKDKILNKEDVFIFCWSSNPEIWDLYIVYRDLRKRGYIPRIVHEATPPTILFSRGKEGEIKYSVFILSEGKPISITELIDIIEKALKNKRIPILAIVDKDGNISYYEAIKAL